MRKLATFTAVAALAAFGFAGAAQADEFADAVDTVGGVTNPADATGADNGAFAELDEDGFLIVKFTDNTCLAGGSNDLRIFDDDDGNTEDYDVRVGLEGEALVLIGDDITEAGTNDLDSANAFTRVSVADATDGDDDGAEFDAFKCLNNLAFGTDHINKAVTAGGTSIVINSKNGADAQQFYSFEIVITNPDGADLSNFNFHDTVPGEFDVTSVVADNTASPTLAGCTNVAFAEHKPGNKLSPDKITWDVDLATGESCTLDVDVETAQKNTSPNKVNFVPTECPAGGVVLNEGIEVHDANDDLILIDDSPIALTCVDPPADPD